MWQALVTHNLMLPIGANDAFQSVSYYRFCDTLSRLLASRVQVVSVRSRRMVFTLCPITISHEHLEQQREQQRTRMEALDHSCELLKLRMMNCHYTRIAKEEIMQAA